MLSAGAALYVAHPAGSQSATFLEAFSSQGWSLRQTLVWVKDSLVLGHADYHFRHEPILYGYKAAGGRRGRGAGGWYGDDAQQSVLEVPRPRAAREHPTMKPVELVEIALRNSSRRRRPCSTPSRALARRWSPASASDERRASWSSTPPTATSSSSATSASRATGPSLLDRDG